MQDDEAQTLGQLNAWLESLAADAKVLLQWLRQPPAEEVLCDALLGALSYVCMVPALGQEGLQQMAMLDAAVGLRAAVVGVQAQAIPAAIAPTVTAWQRELDCVKPLVGQDLAALQAQVRHRASAARPLLGLAAEASWTEIYSAVQARVDGALSALHCPPFEVSPHRWVQLKAFFTTRLAAS